nr:histone 3.3-4 variant [Hofstenia miamia]
MSNRRLRRNSSRLSPIGESTRHSVNFGSSFRDTWTQSRFERVNVSPSENTSRISASPITHDSLAQHGISIASSSTSNRSGTSSLSLPSRVQKAKKATTRSLSATQKASKTSTPSRRFSQPSTSHVANPVSPHVEPITQARDQSSLNVIRRHHRRKNPKPRRLNKKTNALREIRHYQNSTHLLMRHLPFQRLVRDIVGEFGNYRMQSIALECLQEASEAFLVLYFEFLNILCNHARRVTIMIKDSECLKRVKPEFFHS